MYVCIISSYVCILFFFWVSNKKVIYLFVLGEMKEPKTNIGVDCYAYLSDIGSI